MLPRFSSILDIPSGKWDSLVGGGYPFLQHAFLAALERCGGTTTETGWQPCHLSVGDDEELVAAAPLFAKAHSHGEFVYDWHWAAAYERAGGRYYPKLFIGPPFTPATGPRLLGDSDLLIEPLKQLIRSRGLSSLHVSCVDNADRQRLSEAGFLVRPLWQYHWHNRNYENFDQFLGVLKRKRRKNIRQERRRLARDGWRFDRIPGTECVADDWHFMHLLYQKTFMEKGNWPTLNAPFFREIGRSMAERLLVVFAHRGGQRIAGALFFRSDDALYGRYWGALEDHPFLHFETCYYQGIDAAIEAGVDRFEPGAQGIHKIPRGFDPVEVFGAHYFADPALGRAIADALPAERRAHDHQGQQLAAMSAYQQAV